MYVYDKAHELAAEIKKCDDFQTYKMLKDDLYGDENTKNLLRQYKALQFEAQAAMLSGKQPEEETMEKLKKLGEVLAFNPKVTEFFSAEYRFNTLVSDVYKIIGDACELDTGLFDN